MRKALLALAIALFVWGGVVALTGGVDTRILGIPLKSRDPLRVFAAGFGCVLLFALFFRGDFVRLVGRGVDLVRARAAIVALAAAAALAAYGVAFGTFSVGGSDAYGYVNQAYDWKEGVLPRPIALRTTLPFEAPDRLQAPLGYREGREPRTIVPTYAPGLPLIMAVSLAAGPRGPFLIAPACAALLVWFTFALGRRTAGALTGLAAAVIVGVSPVVLHQTVWPMSDVPAAAVWTGATLLAIGSRRRDAFSAGLVTAIGVAIRPNLAPAVLAFVPAVVWNGPLRERMIRLAAFVTPIVPVAVFVGWLNTRWFGSPLNSGYGSAGEIYQWSNVLPNLRLYGSWMWASQTPLILLAGVLLVPRVRRTMNTKAVLSAALLLIAVAACYVSYAQFEVWWYLRFLLPAFGALAVLVAAGLIAVARALPRPLGAVSAGLALLVVVVQCLTFAVRHDTFTIRDSERRYAIVAAFAAGLPADAALLAIQHSGSLRFLTGRMVVRFDWLPYPRSLELVQVLDRSGRHPFLVVDDAEISDVRRWFGIPVGEAPPWPVRARMRELGGVTIYDLGSTAAPDIPVALEPATVGCCEAPRRAAQQ